MSARAEIEAKPGAGRRGLAPLVREAAERVARGVRTGGRPAQGIYADVRRDVMRLAAQIAAGAMRARGSTVPVERGGAEAAVERALRDAGVASDATGALGAVYEHLLALHPRLNAAGRLEFVQERAHARKTSGSYYTPAPVVAHLLDSALEPVLAEVGRGGALGVRVCDPACGCGNFLVAAARRIARAAGDASPAGLARVVRSCIFGVDIDPIAAAVCRVSLRLAAGGRETPALEGSIRVADALRTDWQELFPRVLVSGGFDAVVGNPPYLSQLARETATERDTARELRERFPGAVGAYTDPAALFLLLGTEVARPGGRIALVLPQSVLATRDAAGVRELVAERGAVESLWVAREKVFDAGVMVCSPTIRVGALRRPRVRRFVGRAFTRAASVPAPEGGSWASLAAVDVPDVRVHGAGVLGDVATATADFRDQYYGLRGCVVEAGASGARTAPLVTTGLIDPARCRWGGRPTRFDGRVWRAPRVDLRRLGRTTELGPWAAARLVPKVLLATQTRVLEAVVDARGEWLPAVPVITIVPRRGADLWRTAAVLLCPVASAWAARHHGTAGLSTGAIKLSARQAMGIPLPRRGRAWEAAARLIRRAMGARGEAGRRALLHEAGGLMNAAYGLAPAQSAAVLGWWEGLLARTRGGAGTRA